MSNKAVKYPAIKRVLTGSPNKISFEGDFSGLAYLFETCEKKHGGYCSLVVDVPFRPRSTGKGSQNSHAWGHASQIAKESGDTVDAIMSEAKRRAISRGYPVDHVSKLIGPVPISQADASIEDEICLINELHQIADFLGIILEEGDIEQE